MVVGWVREKTGNWEINCKLHSMCVVWAKAGGFHSRGLWGQQQLHSGLCPHGSHRLVLAYIWARGVLYRC